MRLVGASGSAARSSAASRSVGRSSARAKSFAVPVGTTASGTRGARRRPRGEADRPVAAGDDESVRRAHGASRVADLVDVERLDVRAPLAQGSGERGEVRVPAGPGVRHERETHHPKLPA